MSNAIRYGLAAQGPSRLSAPSPERKVTPMPIVEPAHLAHVARHKQLLIPTETDIPDKVFKVKKVNKKKLQQQGHQIAKEQPSFPDKVYGL